MTAPPLDPEADDEDQIKEKGPHAPAAKKQAVKKKQASKPLET